MQVNNSAAIANSLNYFKKSIVEGFNIIFFLTFIAYNAIFRRLFSIFAPEKSSFLRRHLSRQLNTRHLIRGLNIPSADFARHLSHTLNSALTSKSLSQWATSKSRSKLYLRFS